MARPRHPPGGATARQHPGSSNASAQPPTSDQSVDADASTRCKYGAKAEFCMASSCGPLASTDGSSVGFSTRRDDPSNREFSSIDNDLRKMSPSTAPLSCSLTRTARMVPLTRPQTVTSCAMTLPSICAPSPIRRSEARNSPLIRPKTCAGPLHSILPTIDIPEPMQEAVPAFVVGSDLGGGCSTTDCCWCTVLPTISAAFAATSLSFSGALLLNMPTSVCRLGVHCGKAKLRALIDCPLCEIGCAGISGPALGETQRPLGPSDPPEAWVGIPEWSH